MPTGSSDDPYHHDPGQHGAGQHSSGQQYGHNPSSAQYESGQPGPQPLAGQHGAGQYGAPYGYGSAPRQEEKAIWALVVAILGFVVCPIALHIAGLVLANQSLATIQQSQGQLTGEGMAKAARVLSIIGLALFAVGLLLFTFFVVAFMRV